MEDLLNQTLSSLRSMVDSDTVIGRTIASPTGDGWVIPVSRVTVGLVTASGDYVQGKADAPYTAGGGGAGGSVFPVGFLVMNGNGVRFVSVDKEEAQNKWISLVTSALDAFKPKK